MFSAKFNLIKPFSRLIKKQKLETLDIVYNGQPFCNVVSKNQNTYNLDTTYLGQPFIGTPNNYIKRTILGINHPDVENWLNTVSLNNGGANSTTIAALNTFCNSIDSAGLRSKFYRLNLFCGNNLSSCLVPLYNSVSSNELTLGFSIDSNTNFTTSDYTETGVSGGLIGNGTNKFLLTGLRGTALSAGNRHLSAYEITNATTDYSPSVSSSTDNTAQHTIGPWTASTNYFYRTHNAIGGNANTTKSIGFWIGSDTSTTASVLYKNGSSAATTSAQSVGGSSTNQYAIFASVNSSNVLTEGSEARLGAYSIGLSLNSSEVLSFNTIMQTFQASLNRNV